MGAERGERMKARGRNHVIEGRAGTCSARMARQDEAFEACRNSGYTVQLMSTFIEIFVSGVSHFQFSYSFLVSSVIIINKLLIHLLIIDYLLLISHR